MDVGPMTKSLYNTEHRVISREITFDVLQPNDHVSDVTDTFCQFCHPYSGQNFGVFPAGVDP